MTSAQMQGTTQELQAALDSRFARSDGIYTASGREGYWSNIDRETHGELLRALDGGDFEEVISQKLPHLKPFMFDSDRSLGLKLLGIEPWQVGADYGCMWGNILVAAARRCRAMVGIDKTLEHLQFLQYRMKAEGLDNVFLLNADLRSELPLDDLFDFAIVNGVLEWIPDASDIELNRFFRTKRMRLVKPSSDPASIQLEFLKRVHKSLKPHGSLYLAIENRYDYQYFLWKKDAHTDLAFVPWLPRPIANFFSNVAYGRPYVNYLYSHRHLESLLRQAGFDAVEKHVAFPTYRHPQLILPLDTKAAVDFRPSYSNRPTKHPLKKAFRAARSKLDQFIYGRRGWFQLAPAFIFIAKKGSKSL